MKCAVLNCKSDSCRTRDCSFFTFPTDIELFKKWVQFCRRETYINPKSSLICMKHFKMEDIENIGEYNMGFTKRRLLKRGAVPTIFSIEEAPMFEFVCC